MSNKPKVKKKEKLAAVKAPETIQIEVGFQPGHVVIQFNQSVKWVKITTEMARGLVQSIIDNTIQGEESGRLPR